MSEGASSRNVLEDKAGKQPTNRDGRLSLWIGSYWVNSAVPACLRKISLRVQKLHSVVVVVQWHA